MRAYPEDDFQGFICVCGDAVAVMHAECRALLTDAQLRQFFGGRG